MIRQSVVLNDGEQLEIDMLPFQAPTAVITQRPSRPLSDQSRRPLSEFLPDRTEDIYPLETLEGAWIERALDLCEQNITRAAGLLGVNPSTIYRKRQRK